MHIIMIVGYLEDSHPHVELRSSSSVDTTTIEIE